jgi:hypothetical protein
VVSVFGFFSFSLSLLLIRKMESYLFPLPFFLFPIHEQGCLVRWLPLRALPYPALLSSAAFSICLSISLRGGGLT